MRELERLLASGAVALSIDDAEPSSGLVDVNGRPLTREPGPETEEDEDAVAPCAKCGKASERQVIEMLGGHWRELCACGHEFRRGRGLAPTGGA